MTERQKYGIFKYTMRKDLPRIYLDMDGVLCDFGAQIRKATGKSKEQWMRIDGRVKWDTVIDYPKFWEHMPWNTPGKVLYNFVRKYDPHILSAYLEKTFDPNCIPGKAAWCRKNLGLRGGKVNLVRRRDKQNFAMNAGQPCILIDDYDKNTSQFTAKGGIGITFRSASQAIRDLKKLGF